MNTSILRPIITEKSLLLARDGWFTFRVITAATKKRIATDVASEFKVDVIDVRTTKVNGKSRRTGRKMIYVKKSNWKKAYVFLKKGQTIDLFTTTNEEAKTK